MSTLQNWIFGTRQRSATNPLLVEIGPGRFTTTQFTCSDSGYITLRGSGRQHTTIKSVGAYVISLVPQCNLDVSELTIEAADVTLGALNVASSIGGPGGKTTWSDVDVISKTYGWTESGCSDSTHYWFGSTITTRTGFNIARGYSSCSHTWFYGSEITSIATTSSGEAAALTIKGGEIHIYGGNLRAIAEPGVVMPPADKGFTAGVVEGLVAVGAGSSAEVHIHGTGIDVISEQPNDVAALIGWDDTLIHASESAYVMKTGAGGLKTRIRKYDNSDIRAPHQWHAASQPPGVVSVDGSDMAVETDCSSAGCQIAGTDPHLLLYKSRCAGAGGPWFDVVTGACR
ncbi:MAG: hypothetical protein PVJ83_01970 [Gammaproteobacteria bacterium]